MSASGPGESAFDAAERLAREKAAAVAAAEGDALVVAADTLVVLDGDALGKPRDRADAEAMLRRLQGRRHQVVTGVAVAWGGGLLSGRETTTVVFAPMSDAEIRAYAATGEPDDKAGAYAVQGIGGLFVERVEGSPSNVVGLPVRLLARLLAGGGAQLAGGTLKVGRSPDGARAACRAACRTAANSSPSSSIAAPTRIFSGRGTGPFPSRHGRKSVPKSRIFCRQASMSAATRSATNSSSAQRQRRSVARRLACSVEAADERSAVAPAGPAETVSSSHPRRRNESTDRTWP